MKRTGAQLIGATVFFLLAAAALRNCFPALPNPLRLEARFDAAAPGQADPIVATGTGKAADFLFVRTLRGNTAVFAYDHWGAGGPVSAPVELAPGVPHRLEITMPSLGQFERNPSAQAGPLRVSCDGVVVLAGPVPFYWRKSEQIFIGTNPIGGTSCGPQFHGTLRGPDGRVLRGGPRTIFSLWERIGGFWTDGLWRVWPLLPLAAGIAWALRRARLRPRSGDGAALVSPSKWPWAAVAAGALCLIGFADCITGGSFRFIFPESFGSFYDFQALGLLHGHLDVPPVAIANEAFIFHGKYYGYFGMTPALMRIPFVVLDLEFGELSRSFMCADFAACLIFSFLILRQATLSNLSAEASSRKDSLPSAWAGFLFVGAAGMGSPLFFLASRAYIYHEAILCGAAFALAGCYCTLRYLAEPGRRWWLGALACGLLSTQARPSSGLFALSFTGFAALALLIGTRPIRPMVVQADGLPPGRRPGLHLLVGAGCVLSVLSFNAVSYLKFHTFDAAPLKYHVQYQSGRLNKTGGRNFHLANLPLNFESYLTAPTFRFLPTFPFFVSTGPDFLKLPSDETGLAGVERDLALAGGPKMDQVEPMLGLPYAMPGLCLLALCGVFRAGTRRLPLRRTIALLWVAVVPFTLAMFMAVATAERYTADFCPFLITAAAFGLAAVETARGRAAVLALLSILTLWSVFATLAMTLHYQGHDVWGVSDEARQHYQDLSHRIDRFFHLPSHGAN